MVIKHDLFHRNATDDVPHRAQLRPGAGVEDYQQIEVSQFGRLHALAYYANATIRVDKRQIGWSFLWVADQHLLAERLEDAGNT